MPNACVDCRSFRRRHSGAGYCSACSKARYRARHPLHARRCSGCGNHFIPTIGIQQRCRKDCRRQRKSARTRPCSTCGIAIRRCQTGLCRRCLSRSRAQPTPCQKCGQPIPRRDGHVRRHCSGCVDRKRRMLCVTRAFGECVRSLESLERHKPRTCACCSQSFWPSNLNQRYCSTKHRKRANARRKKARRRGAEGDLPSVWVIYERDRGVCQLCRTRVGRSFVPPHPRAATLDHIVPVDDGGSNYSSNLQLAHFSCNSRKGTRTLPRGEQLRLLG